MGTKALIRQMKESWEGAGHEVVIHPVSGDGLIEALEEAAASKDNDTLVVAGGDGTVSAGAGIAWRSRKVLGVLPAGTMNLFSRSLGTPLAGVYPMGRLNYRHSDWGKPGLSGCSLAKRCAGWLVRWHLLDRCLLASGRPFSIPVPMGKAHRVFVTRWGSSKDFLWAAGFWRHWEPLIGNRRCCAKNHCSFPQTR